MNQFLSQELDKNPKIQILTLKTCIFVILEHFSSNLGYLYWLQTPTMGVIRNPEKISYTLDTKLVNFYGDNLTKIQNTNFDSQNSYFCIFRAVFV